MITVDGVVLCVLPAPTWSYFLQQISGDAQDAGEGEQAAAKIFRLTDEPLNVDPLSEKGAKPADTMGALGFKNIFFAYPSRPDTQVLHVGRRRKDTPLETLPELVPSENLRFPLCPLFLLNKQIVEGIYFAEGQFHVCFSFSGLD